MSYALQSEFVATLPAKSRPAAHRALSKAMRWNRGPVLPRADYIIRLIGEGWRIVDAPLGRELHSPTGSFFNRADLTERGLDFAEWLIARAKPAAPVDADVARLFGVPA